MGDEEYKVLRDEMIMYYNNIANYNIVLFTTSTGIMAYVLNKEEYYYCLIPLMIIIPLFLLCENQHKNACKLGAYLNVFCEGKEYNWERRHHYYDRRSEKRDPKDILPYISMVCVSCISAIMKILCNDGVNKVYTIIPVIAMVCSVTIIIHEKVEYNNMRENYRKSWEEVKKEFEQHSPQK